MKHWLAAPLAALVLAACATTKSKVVDAQSLSALKPGVTTVAEVEAAFGAPFHETKEPDGTDKLQYVSTVRVIDDSGNSGPVVGSKIPRKIEKTVSALLVFDQSGRFMHAWTSDKTIDENVPGNLGKIQQSDISRGSLSGRGI
ncbi:hypothetical protein [Dyella acidiphila]|uniref:Uncharacterized protein n=1 Tax=Dyella acidiphila TaxID=2775866 RepID=A0ABR9GFG4_9GAMM|nr:hypothetical protein [Dyella acidiphila]MBE1162773.1 hypothetical protein [Dyella acidiphila]